MMIYMIMFFFLNLILLLLMIIPSNLIKFNPLTFSLLLVFYMILICLKLNFFNSSFWYSYILFLIMIGGLMILFIYFTSLVGNQLFMMQIKFKIYFMIKFLILFIFLMYFYMEWFLDPVLICNFESIMLILKKYFKIIYMNLMMEFKMDITLYMIFYLFLTMVSSVLICLKTYLPLRQLMKY